MAAHVPPAPAPRLSARRGPYIVLIVVAALYLARAVLIPFALAVLLSFLLAPAVRRLERWRVPRFLSTIAIVVLGFSLIGAFAWLGATQAVSLAAKLPEYRENISAKLRALQGSRQSAVGKAAKAIRQLEAEAAPSQPPLAVIETPATPLAALADFVAPFTKPVGTALAVIIFTILMLLNRENLRERLLVLVGRGRINVTTRAMEEAAERVSRYLRMQLLINAGFGIPFGIALYVIGVPNALLWGLLATVLRFVPYAGVWVAVAMPALLAFAISDGWSMLAWTMGVFLALEIFAIYLAEPLLYSRSAGLSAIAIIAAALFWTWLWGPVGLLLATPLTVCVAVMGRYIPQLGFLNVLLGIETALPPAARFYQRLVALDHEEASELAEAYSEKQGLAAAFDDVIVPALVLAEKDRHQGALDAGRERFIYDTVREIVEDLVGEAPLEREPGVAAICVAPAHDEADQLAALMLVRALHSTACPALALPREALAGEVLDLVAEHRCRIVCISAVPPSALVQARYLAKRLRARFPDLEIAVALWAAEGDVERAKSRLAQAGVNEVVTRLPEAVALLQRLAAVATPPPDHQERAAPD